MQPGMPENSEDTSGIEVNHTPPAYPGKGFRLGEYTITGLLGQGAMATVYQAVDVSGQEVALKVFHENAGVSTVMLERFKREALASKKLRRHPNIITVYSTGKQGPYHYIAMQSIRNSQTLDRALDSTSLSMDDILRIIIKVARALQYAHTRNVIHRDVKPTNIMMDEFGEPLLTDFGVAAMVDWPSFTVAGALTGTPLYMSPEQANADNTTPASDVYSLGVVLFEAICGTLPYSVARTAPIKEVLKTVREELPRRPRMFRKEVSPSLEAVIFKALEKDPRQRYVDAEAFAVDLERILTGKPVSAHHFTQLDRIRHFLRMHERPVSTLCLILIAGAAVGIYAARVVRETRFENLLSLAWMENARFNLVMSQAGDDPNQSRPTAWQDIILARQSWKTRDYERALSLLKSGVNMSLNEGDTRTAGIAQLDLARCEAMVNGYDAAREAYLAILQNSGAPPAVASLAQLEWLSLAMMEQRSEDTRDIAQLRPLPAEGPLKPLADLLLGQTGIARFEQERGHLPERFKNDASFALAARYLQDGDREAARTYLRETAQSSSPRSDWPGPAAQSYWRKL